MCCTTSGRPFQPTLPARGATRTAVTRSCSGTSISTHAPRTGSDDTCWMDANTALEFQPTLPARGATLLQRRDALRRAISTHAPRTGSDAALSEKMHKNPRNFNPRSPHGERRAVLRTASIVHRHFNPRSPHGERLRKVTILSIRIIGFAQKVYHKTVLLRISLAENAVILPEKPRNPVRTSLQKAGGLRFARAIRAARPYSISSPSGA